MQNESKQTSPLKKRPAVSHVIVTFQNTWNEERSWKLPERKKVVYKELEPRILLNFPIATLEVRRHEAKIYKL